MQVHASAVANNDFLEELHKNTNYAKTIRRFPELPPNILQESHTNVARRRNLIDKIPVTVARLLQCVCVCVCVCAH